MAFFKIHIGVKKTQLTHRFWFQSSGLADMPKHTYFFFFFSQARLQWDGENEEQRSKKWDNLLSQELETRY